MPGLGGSTHQFSLAACQLIICVHTPAISLVDSLPRSVVCSAPGMPLPVVLPLSTVLLVVFMPPGDLPLPILGFFGSGTDPPPTLPRSRLLAIVSPAVVPAGCWLTILL